MSNLNETNAAAEVVSTQLEVAQAKLVKAAARTALASQVMSVVGGIAIAVNLGVSIGYVVRSIRDSND